MISLSVNLNVTPLPENDTWFANAQAWNNYWRNISADAEIEVLANTTLYTPKEFNDAAIEDLILNIDGVPYVLVTKAKFDSLRDKLVTLDSSYQQLRTALQTAGIIDNAQ